jgi:crotonobetainyl-CoA:carnitine CoA-transferase CaiB-like acyl-CoA transferase
VFLTNIRQKTLDRWGFSYDRLKEVNPKIIYVVSNGMGPRGAEADTPALDPIGIARSGYMFVGSSPGEEGVYPIGALGDIHTATIMAYATLAALFHRERTGLGQKVDTSHLGSMISLQQLLIYTVLVTGKPYIKFPRNQQSNPLVLEYKCKDGKWLMLGLHMSNYWEPFCKAVERDDLLKNGRYSDQDKRAEHAAELIKTLEDTFLKRTRDEWIRILHSADLIVSPIQSWDELADDPQVISNDYIVDIDHPILGKVKYPGLPFHMTETQPEIKRVAPQFGEHTEEVLLERGFSWEEIQKFREEQII